MGKKCFKCGEIKSLDEFYAHPQMADGHLNKCKQCAKKDATKNRDENSEYYKKYDRKRAGLPHRVKLRKDVADKWKADPKLRKKRNSQQKEWQLRNAEKRAAHVLTGHAIRAGRLVPKPCEVCGKKKVDAHHDDYAQPLKVRWLCKKHHAEHHVRERWSDNDTR